jgi:hypothetical protein
VLEMLDQDGEPAGEPGHLMRAIGRDGLDPGHYWWARASVVAKGTGN